MVQRTTKLRLRRRIKQHKKQVEDLGASAEKGLEDHFFKRMGRITKVWRFMLVWLALMVVIALGSVVQIRGLSQYYQKLVPSPGGSFTEGIIGTFTGANPIYATNAVDSSVAQLVFSGLMKYNTDNTLVYDLANSLEVDKTGKLYTVTIRDDATWHDGAPFTAKDVIFTYETIKDPDARSPLFNTWKDITVKQVDAQTISFELPSALSTFPEALTTGMLPAHVLAGTETSQLRTAPFNTIAPIGTGLFKWENLEVSGTTQESRSEVIGLVANKEYYDDPVKLNSFVIRSFRDEGQMVRSFANGELTSMVGLSSAPEELESVADKVEINTPLTGAVMVFLNMSKPPLQDVNVRRALVQATNPAEAVKQLGYPVRLVDSPLLSTHIGYNKKYAQLGFDVEKANKTLDAAGWKLDSDGVRAKNGQKLTFGLFAQNTADYAAISQYLQTAWKQVGVNANVYLQGEEDISGVIQRHDYEALLNGISIGPDPDVFAYWHSSQASPNAPARLNFSEYKSQTADTALEAGRTRNDPAVRKVKYQPFLRAWRDDAPAIALYQPTFLYVSRGKVFNYEVGSINDITSRYVNVENWMIRQERVNK